MSKKCRAFSVSKLGLESADNRKAFYAGWDAAIEQAEKQKPVACVQDLDEVKRKHLVYEKGMDWKDPLYTTPQPQEFVCSTGLCHYTQPQREWVSLSDEEAIDIGTQCQWYDGDCERFDSIGFARAIEAKLKEKNT